ncbi:MAG: crossover junction endodeoxyribonuclease [Podoviridae sp. ctLUJ1]|nr:MAG: crossover junction endodeoxyribonuclease [Podoviridae sp. ctLUJ1]
MSTKFYTLFSPLKIKRVRAKDFMLNLNVYRNTHFHTLNNMKIAYKELMKEQIEKLPVFQHPIMVKYVLYVGSARLCDTHNICTIIAKFFTDALTEMGKIPDDNYTVVVEERFAFGGIDEANPRVTIYIKEIR